MIDKETLEIRASQIGWCHTIDLGHGVTTNGKTNTLRHLPRYRLPEDFNGKSVLDVGAADGFFSFEAKKRGADRVVSLDRWSGVSGIKQHGYKLAHEAIGLDVECVVKNFYDLPASSIGKFDVVFFMGVLYHTKDPWKAIHAVASACNDLLILETHVDLLDISRPATAFYNNSELGDEASNFCGPNPAAIEMFLKDARFSKVEPVSLLHYPAPDKPGESVFLDSSITPAEIVANDIYDPSRKIPSIRMVYHARK